MDLSVLESTPCGELLVEALFVLQDSPRNWASESLAVERSRKKHGDPL
jgi:hypothetical protein